MRSLKWGATIAAIGASVVLAGCAGVDEDAPVIDEASEAQATLGVAPRGDRFAFSAAAAVSENRAQAASAVPGTIDENPGEVTSVRPTFDPAVFRDAAAFRSKLEIKQ